MKKHTYIACSLLLSIGHGALNASVTATGSKTNFCENESVSVSYSGPAPSSPGSSCCNGSGTWTEDGAATYSWSGDASGSSASATLNTSSSGSKTADVVVTQNWKCSEGSETDSTTENGSGSFTVNSGEAYTGSNPCTPGTINSSGGHSHANVPFSGGSKTVTISSFPFPFVQEVYTYQPGTISSVVHSIVPVAEGTVEKSSACGQGLGTITKTQGGWNSVGISVSLPYGFSLGGSWSGTGTGYTVFDKSDANAESGKWKFGQAYKIQWKLDSGNLTASGTVYNTRNKTTLPVNLNNEPVTITAAPELKNWDYTVCNMCCSY